MKSVTFHRRLAFGIGLLFLASSVGCGSLPWRSKPTAKNTTYEDYLEQSVAKIDYNTSPDTPPPTRLSSTPASPSDRIAAAPSDESCKDGCCH